MGKSTHFFVQPIYGQIIQLLDKSKIQQLSRQTVGSENNVDELRKYYFFG